MKKYQKFIYIFVITLALISCCCFTVFAESDVYNGALKWDGESAMYDENSDGDLYTGPVTSTLPSYDSMWVNGFSQPGYDGSVVLFPLSVNVSAGSTLEWDSFNINIWNRGSVGLPVKELNLILFEEMPTEYGYSYYFPIRTLATVSINNSSFWQGFYSFPSGGLNFNTSVEISHIGVEIRYSSDVFSSSSTVKFSFNDVFINVRCGNPNSPYYPSYEAPSGDSISDLGSSEEAILEDIGGGLSDAGEIFDGFTLSSFTDGLGALVTIYNHLLGKLSWFNDLLTISLALGLFSFIVGSLSIVVGKVGGSKGGSKVSNSKSRKGKSG